MDPLHPYLHLLIIDLDKRKEIILISLEVSQSRVKQANSKIEQTQSNVLIIPPYTLKFQPPRTKAEAHNIPTTNCFDTSIRNLLGPLT